MIKRGKKIQRRLMYRDKININSCKGTVDMYKIVSLQSVLLEQKTVEAGRILLSREWKKQGIKKKKVFIPCGFYIPYTKKGLQSRMGKGKGAIDKHICHVHMYDALYMFSSEGYSLMRVLQVLKKLSYKLPFGLGLVDQSGNLYE
jgi:large subunit ribosomal protein L16